MLEKFKDSVKDFSENVKSAVAEKELDEDTLDPLLESLRLKLLQNNVSLKATETIEGKLRDNLLGEQVKRGGAEEKVNEAVKETLLDLLDDSFELEKELKNADKPPVMFLVGFNGSGKCVSGDTLIYTGSGPVTAEELFERYSDLEEVETERGEYLEPENLNVCSINQGDLSSELKKASKIWKLESEEILDIKLSTGKEISVTPEHPFFRITEGAVLKQRADSLSEGDHIMAPSELEKSGSKPGLWDRLEEGLYIESSEIAGEIYEKAENKTLKELSEVWTGLGYHKDAIQYWRRAGKAPLEVIRALNIEIPENAQFAASEAKAVDLPQKPSRELAEWLGMLVAEGNIDQRSIHIHNKDAEFVWRSKELYEELFGVNPTIDSREGLYRVSTGKATIEKFLRDALGLEENKHSLVNEVVKWPSDLQRFFLKGLYSGDGHVSTSKREIELATASEKTADSIQFMLLNLGIISSKDKKEVEGEKYYRIRINGDLKLIKWQKEIGFSISYKIRDLRKTLSEDKQYEHTELVPNQGEVLKQVRKSEELTQHQIGEKLGVANTMVPHYETESRIDKEKLGQYAKMASGEKAEFLEKLAEAKVSWIKIKEINKRRNDEPVYDLTVPENHNFLANGLVVHNTTTAAKLTDYLDKEVVLGAGDTFRAASIEQLEKHGENIGAEVISHEYESDPAAVGYDTVEHAEKEDKVAIVDTAGRSHADQNLMDELDKMVRVNDPDITFLVVDALAGNDVLEQAEAYEGMFDAVIVTKMDVDENGGAIISISERSGKPVAFLGNGQEYKDLEAFNKKEFVEDIFE